MVITIIIKGGMIQSVENLPKDITIDVLDYDTEGCDPEELCTDEQGGQYVSTTWQTGKAATPAG